MRCLAWVDGRGLLLWGCGVRLLAGLCVGMRIKCVCAHQKRRLAGLHLSLAECPDFVVLPRLLCAAFVCCVCVLRLSAVCV